MSKPMEEFRNKIKEGIKEAALIKAKYPSEYHPHCIEEVQKITAGYINNPELKDLVNEIVEKHPEDVYELKKRVIAFIGEGKELEDSLIR